VPTPWSESLLTPADDAGAWMVQVACMTEMMRRHLLDTYG
jgi:hypothetical protein